MIQVITPQPLDMGLPVGRRPADRFQWLQNFADRDLKHAAAAELDEIRWQVLAFVFTFRADLAPKRPGEGIYSEDPGPFLRRLQKRLNLGLQELWTHRRLTLPRPVVDGLVWRPSQDIAAVNSRGLEQRFFARVVDLLVRVGGSLQICQNSSCGRFFLLSRTGQRYCLRSCSQQVRTGRYRQKHPGRVREWKHHAYAKKRKRQLGPNVKVTRRPRSKASGETRDAHKDRTG